MSVFDTTIGLGSVVLAVPSTAAALYAVRTSRRQEAASNKAAETAEIVKMVLHQVTPSNGTATAKIIEQTQEAVGKLGERLAVHTSDGHGGRNRRRRVNGK